MKIAIDCCDLDHSRIDGTRIYIKNILDCLGEIAPRDQFLLYHQKDFNPLLKPKLHPNYRERKIPYSFCWTQTRLAFELGKERPDILWMPIQQIPLLLDKKIKSVVTIHDLAWKYFPQNYESINRRKLDFFAYTAIKRADRLIAISQSTKKDILKFYPQTKEEKIRVIYHGFNREQFEKKYSPEIIERTLAEHQLLATSYLLYVGGLDDKENLGVLVEAFEKIKEKEKNKKLKLVLVGDREINSVKTWQKINKARYKKDIVTTGRVDFDDLVMLYQNAQALVLPSKYEGFGITVLEGFASKIPVVTTAKSALKEVGGQAACYFNGDDDEQLAEILQEILENSKIREEIVRAGLKQVENFSWQKCARETWEVLRESVKQV